MSKRYAMYPYGVKFYCCSSRTIKFRRKFCNMKKSSFGEDEVSIILCHECKSYLTEDQPQKREVEWINIWPSFYWNLLTKERGLGRVMGVNTWSFIPLIWRPYWLQVLHETFPVSYGTITIDDPPSFFRDYTVEADEFQSVLNRNKLGELKTACDAFLMPVILCPWGCSEYSHRCGSVSLDLIVQRYFTEVDLKLYSLRNGLRKLATARDDFLSLSRDVHLRNKDWEVWPTIVFREGVGPVVLTCEEHNHGTCKQYFHAPKTGLTIPSYRGDQLSHAVVSPRTIKASKANKYSNTYQLNECRGSYCGIDTCDISERRNFSFLSAISDVHESRCVQGRADIMGLVSQLVSSHSIDSQTASALLERAKFNFPSDVELNKLATGSTYMTLSDTLKLQEMLMQNGEMTVCIENNLNEQARTITFARNWPMHLTRIHPYTKYGAKFPTLPNFKIYPKTNDGGREHRDH